MYTRPLRRRRGGGGPEGLILSSVIVAGQRHLCEEQTYLAQQAIHQIAPLDELSAFTGQPGKDVTRDKNNGRKSTPRRRTKRRREMSGAKGVEERGGGGPVVARNEHSSLNVPSFSAETVPRVAPPSGITSGIYEPFILKMVAERRDPKQVATKNFEYGIQPPSSYI